MTRHDPGCSHATDALPTTTKAPSRGPSAFQGVSTILVSGDDKDSPPPVPVDLLHYRRRWPAYLIRPDDRDIIGAVLVSTAWRRRTWPINDRARFWCEAHDPDLLAYLSDVAARDVWHDVHEVRRESGMVVAPEWKPFPGDRRLYGETIASFAAALPRMRALGALASGDDPDGPGLDLGLDHAADDDGEGSGGGRKRKPKAAAPEETGRPSREVYVLSEEEAEALEFETPKPW